MKSSARVTVCGCRSASIGATTSDVDGEEESGVLEPERAPRDLSYIDEFKVRESQQR